MPRPDERSVSRLGTARSRPELAGGRVGGGEGRLQGGRPARARSGPSSGCISATSEKRRRSDGVQDRLLRPVAFGFQQLKDLELELDALAGRDRQAGVVGQQVARLARDRSTKSRIDAQRRGAAVADERQVARRRRLHKVGQRCGRLDRRVA